MTIKVLVPVSGGKDSQACLRLALESFEKNEIMGLFCDTHFEHPFTYKHIEWMREFYGVAIETISSGNVPDKVLRHKRFPGGGARFCTEELKIVPSKNFYRELAKKQGGFEVWLGMRANESNERKKRYENILSNDLYSPNDVLKKYPKYLNKLGVKFRLPIVDWSAYQVFHYLKNEENPLYKSGFDRVGCFPCLASGDVWKEKAFSFDDFGKSQRVIVSELEDKIGKSIFTSKSGARRNNQDQSDLFTGCALCAI